MDPQPLHPQWTHRKTTGVGAFGESETPDINRPLFRVVDGHSLAYAVDQTAVFVEALHGLSDLAMTESERLPALVTAMHYLSGAANALLEEINEGAMRNPPP